jgi:hypothetical protein
VITRKGLLGIIVLLAGLTCGYIASRGAQRLHERLLSNLPASYSRDDIPAASAVNLSTIYDHSKEQFQEVLNQCKDEIMEAARRRNLLVQSRDRVTTQHEAYEQLILQAEREVDLLRLKDYYTQFYMHYYYWLDSGDGQSAVQYKLALGQFKATLDYTMEKFMENPAIKVREYEELRTAIRIAEQTDRTIRWARVVVVILIFLLVMGIPRFIRDSGYKRFSGSLYFDALFRPNMISDLHAWHSTQRMALAFLLLYLFGMVISSSFISWRIPLVLGLLGLLPVIMLTLMSGQHRRLPEILVSFMAPKILILILILGIVALRGPGFFWYRIWSSELFRGLFISLLFMLIFRKFHVNMILARKWSHRNRSGSASMVWMALGLQLLIAGTVMYFVGPEDSLHALNGELLLLPEYLLESTPMLLRWMMIIAGVLTAGALSIFILNNRREHIPSRIT